MKTKMAHRTLFASLLVASAGGLCPAAVLTVGPDGAADFRTISAAAEAARPGDTVLVRPGVYREEVRVPRSGTAQARIVFRSAVRGAAVIRGSEVWTNVWTRLDGTAGCWTSPIDTSGFPSIAEMPYRRTVSIGSKDASRAARPATNATVSATTYLPRTLGQVFVDGVPMTEAVTLAALRTTPDTWMVSPDGTSVCLHPAETRPEPKACRIEWSVRNRCFGAARRGLAYITVDGFTCEHCANQGPFPQIGALDLRSGRHWIVENCTVRHAKTVGIACGSETWDGKAVGDMPEADRRIMIASGNIVRHNTVTDCGVSGIAAWNPGGVRIYGNVIERNNTGDYGEPEKYWDETAGIKIHGAPAVVAGNIVRDNDGHGIWFDTGFTNTRCTGNLVANNRRSGIMFETCYGEALVDNNIIVNTRPDGNLFFGGDGVYSHNGSGVTVAHNLIALNYGAGVRFRTTWGKLGARDYNTSSNRYVNNIFCANAQGELMVSATNLFSQGTVSSGNLYVVATGWRKGLARVPFRFANYRIDGTFSNLWQRCQSAGGAPMPFDVWQAFGNPVDLACWRKVQGLDLDSRVYSANQAVKIASRDLSAVFHFPKEAADFRVPALAGIACDFAGRPYPKAGEGARPGPFQDLPFGEASYRVLRPFVRHEPPRLLK